MFVYFPLRIKKVTKNSISIVKSHSYFAIATERGVFGSLWYTTESDLAMKLYMMPNWLFMSFNQIHIVYADAKTKFKPAT